MSALPHARVEAPRHFPVKPGDTLTLTASVRRLACNGRVAIVSTLGGEVWVPLTIDGQFPDPAVTVTPPEAERRELCDHGLWRPCAECGDQP